MTEFATTAGLLSALASGLAVGAAVGALGLTAGPAADGLNARARDLLAPHLDAVGVGPGVLGPYLRGWRAATAGAFAAGWWVLAAPPLAILFAFLAHRLGPVLVIAWADRRRKRLAAECSVAARQVAGRVRAGLKLREAVADVAAELAGPFGRVLRQTCDRVARGEPFRAAFDRLADTVRVDAVGLFAVSLIVADEEGGAGLADVLDRLSHTLEETERVGRKRDTDTAAGRLTVWVMTAFPAGFLAVFTMIDPDLMNETLTSIPGQAVLATVGALAYASNRWADRILKQVG